MSSTKTVFGAVGVSVLTTYLTQRATAHATDVVPTCVHQVGLHAQALHLCVAQHALTLGMNDTFVFSLIGCIICAVLTIFIGRDPALEAAKKAKVRGDMVEQAPASLLSN